MSSFTPLSKSCFPVKQWNDLPTNHYRAGWEKMSSRISLFCSSWSGRDFIGLRRKSEETLIGNQKKLQIMQYILGKHSEAEVLCIKSWKELKSLTVKNRLSQEVRDLISQERAGYKTKAF